MHQRIEILLKRTCGSISSLGLFLIMWLMFSDVLARKFATHSIPGALELTEILMVVVIFGALPLVSWHAEHIVFDSLDGYLPVWLKKAQIFFVNLTAAGVFFFMAYQMSVRADRFSEYGEVTPHLMLPMWPVAYLMMLFLATTGLVHLYLSMSSSTQKSEVIKND